MSSNGFAAAPDNEDSARAENGASEVLCQGLNAVSGLDVARALTHLRGRTDGYIRLLGKFAETRAEDIESIGAMLAEHDHSGLSALVHNIRGVAGFLGAARIEELAGEIATALRAGRDDDEIERLATALIGAQAALSAGVHAVIGHLPKTNA